MEGDWGLANFSDEGGYVEKYVQMSFGHPDNCYIQKIRNFLLCCRIDNL
jgi:hypothetical protein